MVSPHVGTPTQATVRAQVGRKPWSEPRLVRLGTVATLTSKKDFVGRNDGGTGFMRRT